MEKLILITLLSVLAGRALEMIVGVARVSDLTVFWVLLGMFAPLPWRRWIRRRQPGLPVRPPAAEGRILLVRRRFRVLEAATGAGFGGWRS